MQRLKEALHPPSLRRTMTGKLHDQGSRVVGKERSHVDVRQRTTERGRNTAPHTKTTARIESEEETVTERPRKRKVGVTLEKRTVPIGNTETRGRAEKIDGNRKMRKDTGMSTQMRRRRQNAVATGVVGRGRTIASLIMTAMRDGTTVIMTGAGDLARAPDNNSTPPPWDCKASWTPESSSSLLSSP